MILCTHCGQRKYSYPLSTPLMDILRVLYETLGNFISINYIQWRHATIMVMLGKLLTILKMYTQVAKYLIHNFASHYNDSEISKCFIEYSQYTLKNCLWQVNEHICEPSCLNSIYVRTLYIYRNSQESRQTLYKKRRRSQNLWCLKIEKLISWKKELVKLFDGFFYQYATKMLDISL